MVNAGAVEVWRVLFRMERETEEADEETGVLMEDTEVPVVLRVGDGVRTKSCCSWFGLSCCCSWWCDDNDLRLLWDAACCKEDALGG